MGLDELEPFLIANKDKLILGGDLNTDVALDVGSATNNRHVLERIASFGLKGYTKTNRMKTYRHRRSLDEQWIDDYLFVSKRLKISKFKILYNKKIKRLSDHNPLIIDLKKR